MTNEEFQRLVLQELGEIKGDIGVLKSDVGTLKENVSKLEQGQQAIIRDVRKLEEGQQAIQKDVTVLKEDVSVLKADVSILKKDVDILKDGQVKIRTLIEDLDPKNANRHIEIVNQIETLRGDLNSIEVITSKNWNDIAILKSVK